jgi:hypothetical protein
VSETKSLSELFDEYNERFWDGRLPEYSIKVVDSDIPAWGGECVSKSRTILMRRGLSDKENRRVLLHEMCHIRTYHHGKKFIAQLKHLAELGETWANEEIEMYQNATTWNQHMSLLRDDIEDLAFELEESAKFSDILEPLAHAYGLSPEDLLRKAPWAEATWKKSREKSASYREKKKRLIQDRLIEEG